MRVSIEPAYMDSSNMSYYILPEWLVPSPKQGKYSTGQHAAA